MMTPPPPSGSCPLGSYGTLLELAIQEHSDAMKIPPEMIAPIALAALASAAQNKYNVQRPGLSPSPISLNVMLVAGSGEGKDAAAGPFLEPLQRFEREANETARLARIQNSVRDRLLESRQRAVLAKYSGRLNNKRIRERAERALIQLETERPARMPVPKLIFKDATPTTIKRSLCEQWPSALTYSMEASGFLKSALMRDMTLWNDIWGGAPIHFSRANDRRDLAVAAPRMSMILSIQPKMLDRFLLRRGDEAEDSGLVNRFLWTKPVSTVGTREISGEPQSMRYRAEFQRRCAELLQEAAELPQGIDEARTALSFSSDGQQAFLQEYNQLQMDVNFEEMRGIPGFVAKLAEQMARVAAVLHIADKRSGDIELQTFLDARDIVKWHLRNYQNLLWDASPESKLLIDARILRITFLKRAGNDQIYLRLSELKDLHPDWPPRKLKQALQNLIDTQVIVEVPLDRSKHYCLEENSNRGKMRKAKARIAKKALDSFGS